MNIVVLGGVAAGTKAAAKLMRRNRSAKVTIYTKSEEISYAGCGLPYYVGGSIESREDLIINTPGKYTGLTGVEVRTGMEAVRVNASAKTVTFANGEVVSYDRLIIATGAVPFVPNVPGTDLEGVFTMRVPEDAIGLRAYIEEKKCRSAVVVGAGFIGLEIAENLLDRGLKVTVVDMASQVMPNLFDAEVAGYIRRKLQEKGIRVVTGAGLEAVLGNGTATGIRTNVGNFEGEAVVLSIGVRPATSFLADSGIEMNRGTIIVDKYQKTNLENVYAVGDCAQVYNRLTGKPQWSAMGSTANITGRCLAKNLTGMDAPYGGCLGTGVVKLARDLNAGRTGLTEQQAREAGYDAVSVTCVTDDKAHYYVDASSFVTKLIADRESHKLLGIQVLGAGAVDKMVDIAVTGISMGARIEDFDTLDFAYAPPFSTAIHPFVQACYILENKLSGEYESMTPAEYAEGKAKGYKVIDVSPAPSIPGAQWINLSKVNGPLEGIGKEEKLLLVCARGKRGYFLQNRLKSYGYTNTRALEGGLTVNAVKVEFEGGKLPPEEIKRLKGLGCLQDKRYGDVFNVRVITRNGKITSEEHRVIAEAADRFGSGAVTMTTRLTLEIQGVRHENVQPLMDFLNEHGLSTGGTGSLVRPVVSCKGTTCQYGLCDTFDLSEKLHEKFYVGYHGVTLPHKFKIAVGGCPNNCVKPDLNDLGIIGQRVPMIDFTKCRGCKVCQVEKSCPIHIAKVEDGKIRIDPNACNNCGRCKGKCPFGALEYQEGFKICIGGRWGKKIARGLALSKIFTSEEEVMDVVEKAILLFRDEGISGERFADTVSRLGFEYVNEKLLSNEMDKDAILKKTVKGGATC
ncbi:MAG TPA: FAD-dependent oxidoreductase [Candidatus Pullichristensenella excrementigallinarum]|uniref:FAD-dependent oxidoreductase n=1 Tax=Candidatus Pullichristensenella excrementigallinarum TaxID=2840907 RepID=A0A9D1IC77_9FIRM|nr:FAD-dependent oxidoreductase [Candidatus Pullichristensenella excrementigallinarum]